MESNNQAFLLLHKFIFIYIYNQNKTKFDKIFFFSNDRKKTKPTEMNINEKTISLRNLEIEEKDFKEFHKYLNDFYGKRGVYPNRYGKDLQPRDILKAIDTAASKRKNHDWEWDSLDREIVRDELIKMRKFDYPTQEAAIKELYKVHEDETEDTTEIEVGDYSEFLKVVSIIESMEEVISVNRN